MAVPLNIHTLLGSSEIITIHPHTTFVDTTIVVNPVKTVKLWGYVKNIDGSPLANAHIELVQCSDSSPDTDYRTLLTTFSDEIGCYLFEVSSTLKTNYRILVTPYQLPF